MELEKYYSGEQSWLAYTKMFDEVWQNTEFQNELLELLNGQVDLAQVIYYHNQENSINWLTKKVPALNGVTPIACLHDKTLVKRLKECLMRMK